jgi:DNA-binding PadR family transcriptional regulator
LTTPDLVVLSLLFEAPMHGYQVVRELERREVADWAGVSRPQVYYSLDKLLSARLIRPAHDAGASEGPERTVYAPTEAARTALVEALDVPRWQTQRPPPPFVTWLVLSVHAPKAVLKRGLEARRDYLAAQVAKERETLKGIRADSGPTVRIGESVVKHAIAQFQLELKWVEELLAG